MHLGNFSISLTVQNLQVSKAFYETLGFTMIGGDEQQGWVIMKNGDTNIGLFQGMFDANMLTFNPGWDSEGNALDTFMDVREIQQRLKDAGVAFAQEASDGTGPAHFVIIDPDGNPILVDQHVAKAD